MESEGYFKLVFLVFFVCLVSIGFVTGHGDEVTIESSIGIDWLNPLTYIIIASVWLFILTLLVLIFNKNFSENTKKVIFILMAAPVILSTLFLAGETIYENAVSETRGPIHWHADYQIHVCGERIDLIDPEGLKNKIGTNVFHEHNDDRIHVEGTVKDVNDVNLGSYFSTIGGELEDSPGHLIYPTNEIVYNYGDGDLCQNREAGTLKVYVNGKRVSDFENHLLYPDPNVPPGDCIIVLFDASDSERTDLICDSWAVKGWDYDNFVRREVTIGGRTWR